MTDSGASGSTRTARPFSLDFDAPVAAPAPTRPTHDEVLEIVRRVVAEHIDPRRSTRFAWAAAEEAAQRRLYELGLGHVRCRVEAGTLSRSDHAPPVQITLEYEAPRIIACIDGSSYIDR